MKFILFRVTLDLSDNLTETHIMKNSIEFKEFKEFNILVMSLKEGQLHLVTVTM